MTAVLKRSWLRAFAPLTALMLAGTAAGTFSPAQAAPIGPDAAAAPAASRSSSLAVRLASTEQIQAMAAEGKGQLVALGEKAGEGEKASDRVTIQVTCLIDISMPYGGGPWDADILVDGWVICDDYIHLGVLTVEL